MGHVHLHAHDLQASKSFYTQVFDMDVVIELPNSALFLSHAHYHHHIALNRWHRRSSFTTSANYLTLFMHRPKQDLNSLIERVAQHSIPYTQHEDQLMLEDPNGFTYVIHTQLT